MNFLTFEGVDPSERGVSVYGGFPLGVTMIYPGSVQECCFQNFIRSVGFCATVSLTCN